MPEKILNIKLSKFLEYVLGRFDHVTIDNDLALLIKSLDTDEQFVHVQDAYTENIEDITVKLTKPLLWNIVKWRRSYSHRQDLIKDSKLRNAALSKLHENIKAAAKHIRLKTKLPEEEAVELARELVLKGDHEMLKAMGVVIVERSEDEVKALDRQTIKMI